MNQHLFEIPLCAMQGYSQESLYRAWNISGDLKDLKTNKIILLFILSVIYIETNQIYIRQHEKNGMGLHFISIFQTLARRKYVNYYIITVLQHLN